MNNALIALIIGEIAKNLPALAIDLIEELSKDTPDWPGLRKRWDRPAESFYKTPLPE